MLDLHFEHCQKRLYYIPRNEVFYKKSLGRRTESLARERCGKRTSPQLEISRQDHLRLTKVTSKQAGDARKRHVPSRLRKFLRSGKNFLRCRFHHCSSLLSNVTTDFYTTR